MWPSGHAWARHGTVLRSLRGFVAGGGEGEARPGAAPSARSAATSPPCAWATCRTMAGPGLAGHPPRRRSARLKRSKTYGRSSAAMPEPWSRTTTSPSPTATSTSPSGGLHLTALSSRFEIARSMASGTPRTTDGCRSTLKAIPVGGASWPVRPIRGRPGRDERLPLRRLSLGVIERDQLGHGSLISASCSATSVSRRSRSSGGSASAPPRTSMFVRRLVNGVRGSCDASATKRRWAVADSSARPASC